MRVTNNDDEPPYETDRHEKNRDRRCNMDKC